MNLSSKAKNLIFLSKLNLKSSKIPKFLKYTVEELKIDSSKIKSLGQKVFRINGIDGRFIGITKFSKNYLKFLQKEKIIKNLLIENKKIDFTNFLMRLIKIKKNIYAIKGKFDWTEFDTQDDFKLYDKESR